MWPNMNSGGLPLQAMGGGFQQQRPTSPQWMQGRNMGGYMPGWMQSGFGQQQPGGGFQQMNQPSGQPFGWGGQVARGGSFSYPAMYAPQQTGFDPIAGMQQRANRLGSGGGDVYGALGMQRPQAPQAMGMQGRGPGMGGGMNSYAMLMNLLAQIGRVPQQQPGRAPRRQMQGVDPVTGEVGT